LVNIASVFVAADERLLQHLERDSEWLQQQLGQYGPVSGDFVTKFAFEEYETRTAVGKSIMVRQASLLAGRYETGSNKTGRTEIVSHRPWPGGR
jgi:hypothetical protein